MTPDDGSDDVFIHWKELQQGDTVSYDTLQGKAHCIVISGSDDGSGTSRD